MRVVELRRWGDRANLARIWDELWQRQADAPVFLHPIWAGTWWRYFGHGRQLRLLLVEEGGRSIALAPLFLERPFPVPGRLRVIGAGITNDYSDWLLPDDPAMRAACVDAILAYVAERWAWLTLELQGLRTDSRLFPVVKSVNAHGLVVQPRPGPRCPAARIDGSWASYLNTRSTNLRRKIRNRQRRLATLGDVRYEHAGKTTARAAVDELIHLHSLRWTGQPDVTLISRSAPGRAFYRAVLPRLVCEGIADVVSLRLNGRAIAAQAGFVVGSTYASYLVAFDPSMARYEPGTLLDAYLLEQAWKRGLRTFDFMTGDEPYKYRWADRDPVVTHVTVVPDQPVARLVSRAMDFGRRVRTIRSQLKRPEGGSESRRSGGGPAGC